MIQDSDIYYDEVCRQLAEGRMVELTVNGISMHPILKEGVDHVLLTPVRKTDDVALEDDRMESSLLRHEKHSDRGRPTNHTCGDGRLTLRRRDIVLFRHESSGCIRLHRIVHVWGTLLLIRGDGNYGPYERATVSDVLGVVISGTCFGGHPFKAYSLWWSLISRFWTVSYRVRLWTLLLCRFFRKHSKKKIAEADTVPA